jgi:hypothetical protein
MGIAASLYWGKSGNCNTAPSTSWSDIKFLFHFSKELPFSFFRNKNQVNRTRNKHQINMSWYDMI